jgi:hypothetical protein
MNIELDEVVVEDISDESLELAAGDAKAGRYTMSISNYPCAGC